MITSYKLLLYFSLLFNLLVASCNSQTSTHITYCDTTINGRLILRNGLSIEKNIGDIMQKLDTNKDLPDVYFSNKLKTEYLRLIFFPGDNKNIISVFEVLKPAQLKKNKSYSTTYASFRTESGIKLGIAKSEIIRKKGRWFKTRKDGDITILRYDVDEKNGNDFLKRYNMPLYFTEYRFKDDMLVNFSFGFEYP